MQNLSDQIVIALSVDRLTSVCRRMSLVMLLCNRLLMIVIVLSQFIVVSSGCVCQYASKISNVPKSLGHVCGVIMGRDLSL